jgi:hypothetical protein
VHELGEAGPLLSRIEPVLDAELRIQIAQVPAQRVEIKIDAVLCELTEDLVIRRRHGKPSISVEIRTTERRQDREVRFGHANTWAGSRSRF